MNQVYHLKSIELVNNLQQGYLFYLATYSNGLMEVSKKFDAVDPSEIPTQIKQ